MEIIEILHKKVRENEGKKQKILKSKWMEFYLGFCIVDYDTKQRIKPLANNSS